LLIIRDLVKTYGSGASARRALDGLSLDVRQKQIVGLLGPNGAGKTTTLLIAAGLLRPDSGGIEIRVNGQAVPASEAARHVGWVPQDIALYGGLSARENLAFFAKMYGLRGEKLDAAIARGLDISQLADRQHDRVKTFSGGMKRRLNIAVAMVHSPSVLFLDEPTEGVDPQSRDYIFRIVERLRGEGLAIVYTTHHMEEAERLSNWIAIVDEGRIRAQGPLRKLLAEHGGGGSSRIRFVEPSRDRDGIGPVEHKLRQFRNLTVTMKSDGEAELIESEVPPGRNAHLPLFHRILDGLGEERAHVRGLDAMPPDLHSVFIALTGRELRDDGTPVAANAPAAPAGARR
jgi:ABC-2 type transport system ATP-binding protein